MTLTKEHLSFGQIRISFPFWLLFLFHISTYSALFSQATLTWEDLADAVFVEEYNDEIEGYWLVPNFGNHIKSYQHKEVQLEGYLITLDMDYSVIILSKNPYSSCFFCGMAGPETVVEIQLSTPIKDIKIDQRAKIRGKLILNRDDLEHFNYILEDASVVLLE